MIEFLLGFTIGLLVSASVVGYYTWKFDKAAKARKEKNQNDLEKALKEIFEMQDDDEPAGTVLNLVKKDDDKDPPIQ